MSFARSTLNPSAHFVIGLFSIVALAAAPARAGFDVFSVGGTPLPASIQPTVDAFRAALGDPNNGNTAGPLGSGRREINWDGGGAPAGVNNATPLTAFQNRGATITAPGGGQSRPMMPSTWNTLLIRLRCVSIAPFAMPVVPPVYCNTASSSLLKSSGNMPRVAACALPRCNAAVNGTLRGK